MIKALAISGELEREKILPVRTMPQPIRVVEAGIIDLRLGRGGADSDLKPIKASYETAWLPRCFSQRHTGPSSECITSPIRVNPHLSRTCVEALC